MEHLKFKNEGVKSTRLLLCICFAGINVTLNDRSHNSVQVQKYNMAFLNILHICGWNLWVYKFRILSNENY